MSEFKTYERIINGDLRPHLADFDTEEGLNKVHSEFFQVQGILPEDGNLFDLFTQDDFDFYGFRPGDEIKVTVDFDQDNPEIQIEKLPAKGENELIDLDFYEPPPDKKSEVYYRIIENEHDRILTSLKRKIEKAETLEEFKFVIRKNIAKAKQLGRDAHALQRRLNNPDIGEVQIETSASVILSHFKRYIVKTIQEIELISYEVFDIEVETKFDLRNELFEYEALKSQQSGNKITKSFENKRRKEIEEELNKKLKLEGVISFFAKKFSEFDEEQIAPGKKKKSSFTSLFINEYNLLAKLLESKVFNLKINEYFLIANKDYSSRYNFVLEALLELKNLRLKFEPHNIQFDKYFEFLTEEKILLSELLAPSTNAVSTSKLRDDLLDLLILLQSRKFFQFSENRNNDYLTDLLVARGYNVADQTRSGRSGGANVKTYDAGSLDIAIRKNNGIKRIAAIIEAFEISSCGPKNKIISSHINKLIGRYDASGHPTNFVIVYAKSKNFNQLWNKYCKYLISLGYSSIKVAEMKSAVSDVKSCQMTYKRSDTDLTIEHFFVNMYA